MDDIKTRGMIPTSQSTYTEARLKRLANAVLRSEIVPIIDKVHNGYYGYNIDTAINATGKYNIHRRAIGAKLLDACLITGTQRKDLALYSESELNDYDAANGEPGFFLRRNSIYLVPISPTGTYLRQSILLCPAQIVGTDEGAQITAINTGSGLVTCDTVPSEWTSADTFDFVMAEPHFDTLAIDKSATVVTGSGGTLTFAAADLPSDLAVGDWIGLAGQSPVVQCPEVILPLLAQRTASVCLRGLTDVKAYELSIAEAERMEKELLEFLDPRVTYEGKKISNRTGILRRGL